MSEGWRVVSRAISDLCLRIFSVMDLLVHSLKAFRAKIRTTSAILPRAAASERSETEPPEKRVLCTPRCLAWIFVPLLRTLIRSRMFYPLPHHLLAKTQISCARAAASFLFYKSHKSYKSYFYQATGCTPGGKRTKVKLSRPREVRFAHPRPAASFLFYKSHKSYKSYKSYFYQATGCTPGGKQASAPAANKRQRS